MSILNGYTYPNRSQMEARRKHHRPGDAAIGRRAFGRALTLGAALAAGRVRPAGASIEALFAPGKDLWPRWARHDETARRSVDHAPFQDFLGRYLAVDAAGIARFAYARVSAADRALLAGYLATLAAIPATSLARAEQRAFWINLYNALTLHTVLAHYPVRSILDIAISPGLFAKGPWGKALVAVEGEALTLNDIEHRILRPIWNDPRLHYAVNCASIGCPNLQQEVFTADNAERLLEAAARGYVNHPRGARIEAGGLVLSKIYDWYQEDFGGSERGVLEHLRRHAAPPLAAALARNATVDRYEYDWALNDARPG